MNALTLNASVLVALTVVSIAVFIGAPVVPFAQQWPLYEALRTTAAIIFAVVGAWIAIAYPERLRLLRKPNGTAEQSTNASMLDLFAPVVHSTFILCVILVAGIIAPLLRAWVTDAATTAFLLRVSFALLVFLTLWQVWTVILTLLPADLLKSAMDRDISAKAARDALRGRASVVAPPSDNRDD